VNRSAEFVGRVEAIERVDVRARVTGFLQQVDFKEGDIVKEGDTLFQIEPDSFDAAVQQARGALLQAQAQFANASAQRARTEELVKTDTAARATLDQRVAAEKTAQGDVITADANLKTAIINLGYTKIVSPITGEAGRSKLTKGNVVGPDAGVLVTVVSRDPMYVTFPVSQREFLAIEQRGGNRREAGAALTVRLRFSDNSTYAETGRINFVDVAVNRATDTVLVRATVPNPKGSLIDGQLVRVAVEADTPQEQIVIPQAAVILDQQGPYVFAVESGKAAVKRIKLGVETGASFVVTDGLKPGDQVVVQGMETLRPGTAVTASPASVPSGRG
jgi:membrane fusion protein (multidrug efflux system)